MNEIVLLIFTPINILLGLVLLFNNSRSWTNRLFALFVLVITIYLVVNTELYIFPTFEQKFLMAKFISALGSILNLLVLLFLVTFPGEKITMRKSFLYPAIFLTAILVIGGIQGLIFSGITIEGNVVTPVQGVLMPLFLLHTLFFILGGIITIFSHYRKSRGLDKRRIGFVFLSFFVLFGLIIIFNFILPSFFKIGHFVPFLPFYILVFNFIVGYAIVRHKLMDIRMLVARTVAFSVLIVLFGGFYSIAFFVIGAEFLSIPFTQNQLAIFALFSLVIALTFQPLKKFIEKATDKLFYRRSYDSDKLLKLFSHIMSVTLELHELTEKILEEITEKMKVSKAVFVLLSAKQDKIDFLLQKGYAHVPQFKAHEVTSFFQSGGFTLFDDLEEGSLKNLMREKDIKVALPLSVSGNRIGILFLGEKATGEIYSQKDIAIFEILAPELSVAIRNSQAYEEIKRFNITLQQEVNRATKELKDANEKLKALDKLKDEFVSLASHELRTPMTAIKSYLWMALAGKGGDLQEKQKYYIDRAYTSTERLIKLVNEMLNVSRIESGRITLEKKEIDINQLTDDVIADVLPRAQELGIHLEVNHVETIPHVFADPDKIKEVFINLIGNSLKFTPKDGKIIISFIQKNGKIEISVTDTGKGIAPDDISKLFQKFGKVDNDYLTVQNVQGTGLGLYISKSIIQLHGGDMWVNSEGLGKGATFTFSLPISDSPALLSEKKELA